MRKVDVRIAKGDHAPVLAERSRRLRSVQPRYPQSGAGHGILLSRKIGPTPILESMKKSLLFLLIVANLLSSCQEDEPAAPSNTGTGNTPGTADCLGVIGGSAVVGAVCNDNNPATINDTFNADCVCVGQSQQLSAPQLIAPPNGIQGIWSPITFSWGQVSGAACYEGRSWYYSNNGTQQTFTLSNPCYVGESYTPASSLGTVSASNSWCGKTIFWHVRACTGHPQSGGVCGPWSATYSFVLDE